MADEQELDTNEAGVENIIHQVEIGQDPATGPQEYPEAIYQRQRIVSPDTENPGQDNVTEARESSQDRPELPPPDTGQG